MGPDKTRMDAEKHEKATIEAFIVPEHQTQYVSRLSSEKTRIDFINRRFYHMRDLEPLYAHRIEPRLQFGPAILEDLRSRGAPETCYVFGGDELDQRVVPLEEALSRVVGSNSGTFISCIPGKLAYFEGEEQSERYVLER